MVKRTLAAPSVAPHKTGQTQAFKGNGGNRKKKVRKVGEAAPLPDQKDTEATHLDEAARDLVQVQQSVLLDCRLLRGEKNWGSAMRTALLQRGTSFA